MKAWLTGLAPALLVAVTLGVAVAKLPPTPPMDPAKAEEKKAKGKAVTPQMASNSAEMEAKAKEAAAKVPGAQPAPAAPPAKPMAAAMPMAPKK